MCVKKNTQTELNICLGIFELFVENTGFEPVASTLPA